MKRLKELFQRTKEEFFPSYKMGEREKRTYETLEKICKTKSTEFKVAPLKEAYYILNEDLHIKIKLSSREVKFVNGTYFYSYQFPLQFQELMLEMVGKYIEEDRDQFEAAMFAGELDLLGRLEDRVSKIMEK